MMRMSASSTTHQLAGGAQIFCQGLHSEPNTPVLGRQTPALHVPSATIHALTMKCTQGRLLEAGISDLLAPLCPPQIPFDQTRARTRAAAVGSQRLTA
jgi:hypothetical protein